MPLLGSHKSYCHTSTIMIKLKYTQHNCSSHNKCYSVNLSGYIVKIHLSIMKSQTLHYSLLIHILLLMYHYISRIKIDECKIIHSISNASSFHISINMTNSTRSRTVRTLVAIKGIHYLCQKAQYEIFDFHWNISSFHNFHQPD